MYRKYAFFNIDFSCSVIRSLTGILTYTHMLRTINDYNKWQTI